MIRPARPSDGPAIERLIVSTHARSKYTDRADVAPKACANLVNGLIAGMNQHGPQGTHVAVNEENGKVVGFVAGALNRVYNVLDKLAASDVFLINEGRAGASLQLLDSYIAWASANPKVLEIGLTWTDALPGADRIAAAYRRKGFRQIGEIYEMRRDAVAERAAA